MPGWLMCSRYRWCVLVWAAGCSAAAVVQPAVAPEAPRTLELRHNVAPAAIDPEASEIGYPFLTFFYPLESQRQKLRMAYMEVTSSRPNGRHVVLLHGESYCATSWASTIALLTQLGFHVIAPDQVGFGKSSKPSDYQYSYSQLAANTRALLASLGVERAVIIGHSMGATLAARYALDYPAQVEQLVLVNPLGLEDYRRLGPYQSIDARYATLLKRTPMSIRLEQSRSYFAGVWNDAYEQAASVQIGMAQHPEYARVAWDEALVYDMIYTQPIVSELAALVVPTGLVIGTRDKAALYTDIVAPAPAAVGGDYGALAQRTRDAIPGATLFTLEGVGHVPQLEAFERYRDALLQLLH